MAAILMASGLFLCLSQVRVRGLQQQGRKGAYFLNFHQPWKREHEQ